MSSNNALRKSGLRKTVSRLFNRSIFSRKFGVAICGTREKGMGRKRADYVFDWDFLRSSSLEYVSIEIYDKKIYGNVAELGVARGDFAEKINMAFPDRKLYLFDTFEGYNEKDVENERALNYKGVGDTINALNKQKGYYLNTSEEIVLQRMKFRENCIIRKGYFPETANGIEDKFVFVNIDVGLYQPVYNGLKYFYPRLVKGGYIFISAYSSTYFLETKQAIRKYCEEEGITLFPLSDLSGSAIIMK
jgi:O-methyltransferase